jgi:hypothetical protein
MEQRQDIPILSALAKYECITQERAKQLAALSLMVIPDKADTRYPDWVAFMREQVEVSQGLAMSHEDFCLYDCVVHYAAPEGSTGGMYGRIHVISDDVYHISIVPTVDYSKPLHWVEVVFRYDSVNSRYIEQDIRIDNLSKDASSKTYTHGLTRKQIKEHINAAWRLLGMYYYFCRWNMRQDRFAVSVEREPGNYRERGELWRTTGPSIIYLNALPATGYRGEVTGQYRTIPPHERLGYQCTLSHERFRNHQDFQIYKGHYRGPAYIGDRARVVNGKVYTILTGNRLKKKR